MADAPANQTDWTKLGSKTSEFLTSMIGVGAGILTILGAFYSFLSTIHDTFPQVAWVSAVMGFIGGILALGSVLGYNKGRSVVKAGMAQVDAAALTAGQQPVFANPTTAVVASPK